MSKKRLYEIHKVEYTEQFTAAGKQQCILKIYWKATKHNRLGTDYEISYVVKSLEDAQSYVDRIVKKTAN